MSALWKVFYKPVEAFEEVKEKPSWALFGVAAAIFLLGVVLLEFLFRLLTFKWWMFETLRAAGYDITWQELLSDPDLRQLLNPDFGMIGSAVWRAFIMAGFGLTLQGVLAHFALVKEQRLWPATLSVFALSKLTLLVGMLLKVILGPLFHNPFLSFSLGVLVPAGPLALPLQQIDIFSLWSLVLAALGLGVLTEKKGLAFGAVFVAWGAWVAALFIKAALFG